MIEDSEVYEQAKALVIEKQRASISMVQRFVKVGYNQAARALEKMEDEGVISSMAHDGARTVLIKGKR